LTRDNAGQTVNLRYWKDGDTDRPVETKVKLPAKADKDRGFLGVATQDVKEQRYTWSAPLVGIVLSLQLAAETLLRLGGLVVALLTGHAASAGAEVGGPVLIVYVLSQLQSGSLVLFLMATVSIALAVFNALPLPALDGGRLALTAVFAAVKKPLTERTENLVHGIGFAALLILAFVVTALDISRVF